MLQKRTRLEENKIIIWNLFFGFCIFAILWIIFFHAYPQIEEIEKIKIDTISLNENLNKYKKEWLPLEEFKNSFSSNLESIGKDKNYLVSFVKEVDQKFYDKNLKNTKEVSYEKFISKKEAELKNNVSNEEKLNIISRILPFYSDKIKDKNTLTDFEFINYIESIISTFQLLYENPIWIKEIKQVEDYTLNDNDFSLDKWIYQIPIELDIVWAKSSIIEFLYFIENVWKISLNEDTKEIIVNNDFSSPWEIFSDFRNKKINWAKDLKDYNIFNNQIIDIEEIFIKDYIDSSDKPINYTSPESKEFLRHLRFQGKDRLEVKIKINFYVKWLPKYKIDDFILNFNKRISKIEKDINSLVSKVGISSSNKQKLRNIKISIDNIKSIVNQNKSSEKNIEEKFQDLTSYNKVLDEYEEKVKQIQLNK